MGITNVSLNRFIIITMRLLAPTFVVKINCFSITFNV